MRPEVLIRELSYPLFQLRDDAAGIRCVVARRIIFPRLTDVYRVPCVSHLRNAETDLRTGNFCQPPAHRQRCRRHTYTNLR